MRLSPALLAVPLLVSLLALTPAGAQGPQDPAPFVALDDDQDDVQAQAGQAPPTAIPAGVVDTLDLRSMAIQEHTQDLQVTLTATAFDAYHDSGAILSNGYFAVLRHDQRVYKLSAYVNSDDQVYGVLEALPPGSDPATDYGDYVAEVPAAMDVGTDTLTWTVPRDLLVDDEGAPPYPGRTLDLFMAAAWSLSGGDMTVFGTSIGSGPSVMDRMPDTGAGDKAYAIQLGIRQDGDLRLQSAEPFRASNGESATFVFRVNATNIGDGETVAEFTQTGAPVGWDVRLPGMVRLEAGESIELPIVVHTSFTHTHGSATAFTLALGTEDGSSVGRIQLGLRYPKIAQPAGHHNQVFLHSQDATSGPIDQGLSAFNYALSGYDYRKTVHMNTADGKEEDPSDDVIPVEGQTCEGLRIQDDNDTVGTTYCWFVPLSPGLEMGLDFDLAGTGQYQVPIHSLTPQPGTRVAGSLVYFKPGEDPLDPFLYYYTEPIEVATLLPSDRVDIAADGSQVFSGTIVPLEDGDFLPYARGASLHLMLEVRTDRPDNFFLGPHASPELQPGAWMILPLLEYEDPLDEVYATTGSVHLILDGDAHREANPGDTVVYSIQVHNADNATHDFAAALIGANSEWGRIVGADGFALDPDGSRKVTVAVTVPADAADGDRADLVLEVASGTDIAVRGLLRLVTTADTDAEHDDQASLLGAGGKAKGSPGPEAGLVALALLGLALSRRL